MWLKLIPKLHWEHGVPVRHEMKEHETVVSALKYAIPESITIARHADDLAKYEKKRAILRKNMMPLPQLLQTRKLNRSNYD